ncbi:receptor-like protein kinase [Prunus yedoensis var. nudiflora]|uniref:Receptor-like protein kinase n=1 Tax=Prunus yedoensis var. nudiflora TaxID=2094558 RepID=A0A314XG51_PRUYE|nr:receptor-like protein kinase [Prunus yedoensis var. nudiflora]
METFKHLSALLCGFALILLVHAQDDQSGFISLDCGLPTNSSYSEPTTGLDYISDAAFISTGVSKSIAAQYKATHQQQTAYVRSFPQGVKNCYRVNITQGTKYLIRASFVYGNYDGLNKLPKFDLLFGANSWDSVAFVDASSSTIKELVHVPTIDYIHVCLVDKGSGTPFISALELRPLKNTTYVTPTGSLKLFLRLDVGSTSNQSYRYDYDALDRIWVPYNYNKWTQLTTSLTVDAQIHNDYQVPSIAMRTASTPIDASAPMDFRWESLDTSTEYYVYLHFAELQQLKANQSRAFNITLNGDYWFGPFVPKDLSSSGLTGEITSYISNLAMLQSLDLSNNSLTGSVPEFLSKLPNLKVLNLERNKLNGSVPADLIQRSTSGSLSLSVGENADLCASISCKKEKKKNIVIPIIASIGGFSILVVAAVAIFMGLKRGRKQGVPQQPNNQVDSFESKKRQFTYSDVLRITNNFQTKVLGRGGFGKVYHGYVDDTQVAVKMLSPTSGQGYQQFQAEACEDSNANVLTWEGRLQIATDAAQGLEYLHNGCKPPILHRDVKATNILLAENFQAKLADFGLSRIFPTDGGTHMSTAVAGTPGYLDPEYHTTGWLNEKSDVYSFGVVLLEIITSRHVISRTQEKVHVSQWVSSMLAKGDIKTIVDPRLCGDYEINSAWKAVELAMECVSETSTRRPNMSAVVTGLKECLAAELARTSVSRVTESADSVVYSMNVTTELSPLAR